MRPPRLASSRRVTLRNKTTYTSQFHYSNRFCRLILLSSASALVALNLNYSLTLTTPASSTTSGDYYNSYNYIDDKISQVDSNLILQFYERHRYENIPHNDLLNDFPSQNRKGQEWNGWPKLSYSDNTDENFNRNNNPDNDQKENNKYWWRNTKSCFEVHHICHGRTFTEFDGSNSSDSTNKSKSVWFYYTPHEKESSHIFQPSLELRGEPYDYDGEQKAEKSIWFFLDAQKHSLSKDHVMYRKGKDGTNYFLIRRSGPNQRYPPVLCRISKTHTQMILQSSFNFMMGEFYVRALLPMYYLMRTNNKSHEGGPLQPYLHDVHSNIQYYVHFTLKDYRLMDGHKLFLNGMNSVISDENYFDDHIAEESKSFLDLFKFRVGEKIDWSDSLDCQCVQTMVFCGYDSYTEDEKNDDDDEDISNERSIFSSLHNKVNKFMKIEKDYPVKHLKQNEPMPDKSLKYTLWPASGILDDSEIPDPCVFSELHNNPYKCDTWNGLRSFLLYNLMKRFPHLDRDVSVRRKEILLDLGHFDESDTADTKEWTIIGLTQRTSRRIWINLPEVMNICNAPKIVSGNKIKQKKVACIEINVEQTRSPYEQLLLHRSIDALIGIHGAQLTQAVLLPPHGHVLELLPWVPDFTIGDWVQTRHHPTPLGVIYHNTDLYHLGYSLGRDSVSMCQGTGEVGSEKERECFQHEDNEDQFYWANRNFVVHPDTVTLYVERFLLATQTRNGAKVECNDLVKKLDRRFVLYNVWCESEVGNENDIISQVDQKLKLRHYYDENPSDDMKMKKKKRLKRKRMRKGKIKKAE